MTARSAPVAAPEFTDQFDAALFGREGVELDRSSLADWVGKSTDLLEPLADAVARHVLRGQAIFADDTPVKMLAPGSGKTKTARLWAYVRDERPWAGESHPAAWYQFSPDRKDVRPSMHLANYKGSMAMPASMTSTARAR